MSIGIEPEGQVIVKDKRTLDGYRYIYLSQALTDRIIRELKHAFAQHPRFGVAGGPDDKIHDNIRVGFPQKKRPQRGIFITNVSGGIVPLQSDNFHGTLVSHVVAAAVERSRGSFLSWVKEDPSNINIFTKLDVSDQANGLTANFTIPGEFLPVVNPRTGVVADGANPPPYILRATVGGSKVDVNQLDGKTGEVILSVIPSATAKVEFEFWALNLEHQGLYFLRVLEKETTQEGNQAKLSLRRTHYVDDETLTESWDGATLSFTLSNAPILEGTVFGYVNDLFPLVEGTDYSIDLQTGTIDLVPSRFSIGDQVFFEYRYDAGEEEFQVGPQHLASSRNDILKGVVLAFSDDFVVGDEMVVIVNNNRVPVAEEYGGRADLSMSFRVYCRDPRERDEVYDLLPLLLYVRRKPALDMDGVTVKAPSLGGWGTEVYDESSGDIYYTADVSIEFQTDWRFVVPVPVRIRRVNVSVSSDFDNVSEIERDRHVYNEQGRPTNRNMERVIG
jgi:hypothetical protein